MGDEITTLSFFPVSCSPSLFLLEAKHTITYRRARDVRFCLDLGWLQGGLAVSLAAINSTTTTAAAATITTTTSITPSSFARTMYSSFIFDVDVNRVILFSPSVLSCHVSSHPIPSTSRLSILRFILHILY